MLLSFVPITAAQRPKWSDLPLKDTTGETHRLSDYRGKIVLLNFWATWCPPCLAEMPDLVNYQGEYRDKGIEIIGVTQTSPLVRVRRIIKDQNINYEILLGTTSFARQFNVGSLLPVTVIIDQKGVVRDRIEGFITPEEFEQKVKPLFKN